MGQIVYRLTSRKTLYGTEWCFSCRGTEQHQGAWISAPPLAVPPRKVVWQIYKWARSRAEERLTSSILLSSFSSLFSWRDLLSRKLQNWDQLKDFVPSRFVFELITPRQILLIDPLPILLKYWPTLPALSSRGHRRGQWECEAISSGLWTLGIPPPPTDWFN